MNKLSYSLIQYTMEFSGNHPTMACVSKEMRKVSEAGRMRLIREGYQAPSIQFFISIGDLTWIKAKKICQFIFRREAAPYYPCLVESEATKLRACYEKDFFICLEEVAKQVPAVQAFLDT